MAVGRVTASAFAFYLSLPGLTRLRAEALRRAKARQSIFFHKKQMDARVKPAHDRKYQTGPTKLLNQLVFDLKYRRFF
jgi:hypothetical protein